MYYQWLQFCFWKRNRCISGTTLDTVLLVTLPIARLITSNAVVDPKRISTMMVIAVLASFNNIFPPKIVFTNDKSIIVDIHYGRHGDLCEEEEEGLAWLPPRLAEEDEPLGGLVVVAVVVLVRIAPDLGEDVDGSW